MIKKEKDMSNKFDATAFLTGVEVSFVSDKCDKCNEHSSTITYKEKNYCTWYCAKKVK